MVKNNLRDCLTGGELQRIKRVCVYSLMPLPRRQLGTVPALNIFLHSSVDLPSDLLYTVCSEHEIRFNTHLQERAERAADSVSTMLTI